MRILVISNMFPTKEVPAFGIFVKNQVDALAKHGHDVQVAAIKNAKMGKVNVLKKYSMWMLGALRRLLQKKSPYDIVHAHYAFPSGLIARWFKKRFGIPYVVTCHGGDLNKMAKKGAFFRKQTTRILEDAAHVIVVGHDLEKQVIHDYHIPPEKVSVISMGVDRSVFYERSKTETREHLTLSPDSKHLLFVGNLIKEKGIGDLIEAFVRLQKDVPEAVLHVVGQPKQEGYYNELRQRVHDLQAEDAVHFHGAKPQKEVAEWMSAVDVFVLPSHIEGFGLVAVEAMACGTPVVGTDTGGLSHLLKNDAGVLAEPQSPPSLAQALKHVLEDERLYGRLIQNGRKQAELHDSESTTKKVIRIYEEAQQRNGERQ
ncbi:glycosyltransferase family 4 protein [Bacillus piscicola]|uniref:glycosyltransferase family 4 protein n=1 Tax=Bacillus piscicola TaxID=1632684 RepID=UPI001F099B6E|nr:glycosyltransferase family 4 protein [Bacillus piscicola]